MNAELRQQPVADEGADQADDQIADQAKPAAGHHPAGKPAGDDTDDENDQKTLVGKVHGKKSPGQRCPRANPARWEKFHGSSGISKLGRTCRHPSRLLPTWTLSCRCRVNPTSVAIGMTKRLTPRRSPRHPLP